MFRPISQPIEWRNGILTVILPEKKSASRLVINIGKKSNSIIIMRKFRICCTSENLQRLTQDWEVFFLGNKEKKTWRYEEFGEIDWTRTLETATRQLFDRLLDGNWSLL